MCVDASVCRYTVYVNIKLKHRSTVVGFVPPILRIFRTQQCGIWGRAPKTFLWQCSQESREPVNPLMSLSQRAGWGEGVNIWLYCVLTGLLYSNQCSQLPLIHCKKRYLIHCKNFLENYFVSCPFINSKVALKKRDRDRMNVQVVWCHRHISMLSSIGGIFNVSQCEDSWGRLREKEERRKFSYRKVAGKKIYVMHCFKSHFQTKPFGSVFTSCFFFGLLLLIQNNKMETETYYLP
jgi:hypothetical protein